MSPGPTSPFFTIGPTSYGGRGGFASQDIPKDTLILSCQAPYANVICRKFRKEVCAWCFSWSWEDCKKNNWTLTVPLESQQLASARKSASNVGQNRLGGTSAGVRFCGESCRSSWLADGEDATDSGCLTEHAGIRGLINSALERCITVMEKARTKPRTIWPLYDFKLGWIAFFQTLEELKNGDNISLTLLEDTWERAEQIASHSRTSTPSINGPTSPSKKMKSPRADQVSSTMLSEVELDSARLALTGLVNKCVKELSPNQVYEDLPPNYSAGTWSDVLDLQDNSLPQVQLEPYMLASNIRIWAFIKFVVYSASGGTKGLSEKTKNLIRMLKECVDTPDATRVILGREPGNAFGIWDKAPEGVDEEMLGWGLYSFGTYFNHDCSPTVYKKAKGRAMEFYTLRDVSVGEELCISYIKRDDEVKKRREALKGWFFKCTCKRCESESRT